MKNVFPILLLLVSSAVMAHNKVVVVPLGGNTGSAAASAYTDVGTDVINPHHKPVQSLAVNLPTKGHLVANASWRWQFAAAEGGQCTITLDSVAFSTKFRNQARVYSHTGDVPGSTTALFTNVPAGNHTVRIICVADPGDQVFVMHRNLTVLFVPGVL